MTPFEGFFGAIEAVEAGTQVLFNSIYSLRSVVRSLGAAVDAAELFNQLCSDILLNQHARANFLIEIAMVVDPATCTDAALALIITVAQHPASDLAAGFVISVIKELDRQFACALQARLQHAPLGSGVWN